MQIHFYFQSERDNQQHCVSGNPKSIWELYQEVSTTQRWHNFEWFKHGKDQITLQELEQLVSDTPSFELHDPKPTSMNHRSVELEVVQTVVNEIIAGLETNDEVVIVRNSQPVVRIFCRKKRKFGGAKGLLTIVEEDDEHLKDFEEYMP